MSKLYLTVAGCFAIFLSACTKAPVSGARTFIVHPGQDITVLVNLRTDYSEFLLEGGSYTAFHGENIFRNNIIIRRKDTSSEVRITEAMQISGNNNIIDGLTWNGSDNEGMLLSDPGTRAVSGSGNTIRHCIFRNMQVPGNGTEIISIGRSKSKDGHFTNTVADNNLIEDCVFDDWGLRGEPKGSTKSSTCISVGEENLKGRFTGTIIRNNAFLNGPYKEYGYNAAVKVFNSVLLENNLFYGGQECLEIKYGNSTFRGNTMHHFSGYNILANRSGRNNLYENNVVYDVRPVDKQSSSQGFMIWDAGNTVYRSNLVYDCAQAGLILGKQTTASNTLQYVLIENNTFIGNNTGIHFNNQMGSPRHVFLRKNILCGKHSLPVVYMLSGFDPTSIDNYSENLYYNNSSSKGDDAPVVADPQFVDTSSANFALQSNSPGCGFGAFPCSDVTLAGFSKSKDYSSNIVIYPTRNSHIFHVGLTGLDVIPLKLDITDRNGASVASRLVLDKEPTDLKIIQNIDLTKFPAGTYTIKVTTSAGVITQQHQLP